MSEDREPPEALLEDLRPDTKAIRAGREDNATALAPIIWTSTTYVSPSVEAGREMASAVGPSRFYTRYGNPSIKAFEDAIAALEGAEAARAFASGMGAVSGVVLGLCSSGDHVVTQRQLYAGTQMLFQSVCPRFNIEVSFVDGTVPGAFAEAVRPGKTVLVFAETPANPRLDIVDLEEIGSISGPVTVVDSTFAPPLIQRPLAHGVDLSLHSATKMIGGHNDATLGVVSGSRELLDWIFGYAVLQGANASPYDATNGLRGIRTLGPRLRQQTDSALRLAETLAEHPAIEEMCYPGLSSHQGFELAKRQMELPGGLLTFDVAGGLDGGRCFVESLRVAQLAPSLGGPETLVTHPASTTHVSLLPDELEAAGIRPGTVRVSVGLEDPGDIVADFLQALEHARSR